MVSAYPRPPEIEERQFPGYWEGDLIEGTANESAVGKLPERNSRLLILVKLPEFKPASAASAMRTLYDSQLRIAAPLRQGVVSLPLIRPVCDAQTCHRHRFTSSSWPART